jgi:hypothetical protein
VYSKATNQWLHIGELREENLMVLKMFQCIFYFIPEKITVALLEI